MEYQKIINLLDNGINQLLKFRIKNCHENPSKYLYLLY